MYNINNQLVIKPFTMAALGIIFFKYLYAGWILETEAKEYIDDLKIISMSPPSSGGICLEQIN